MTGLGTKIPSVSTLTALIKSSLTIEAQEEIMRLRDHAISLLENNIGHREEIIKLKERIRELASVDRCPKCKKETYKLQSSDISRNRPKVNRRIYECSDSECGFSERKDIPVVAS